MQESIPEGWNITKNLNEPRWSYWHDPDSEGKASPMYGTADSYEGCLEAIENIEKIALELRNYGRDK